MHGHQFTQKTIMDDYWNELFLLFFHRVLFPTPMVSCTCSGNVNLCENCKPLFQAVSKHSFIPGKHPYFHHGGNWKLTLLAFSDVQLVHFTIVWSKCSSLPFWQLTDVSSVEGVYIFFGRTHHFLDSNSYICFRIFPIILPLSSKRQT